MSFLRSIALALVFVAGQAAADEGIQIKDPYARVSPNSGAVFLTLENAGAADDRLVGASSDVAMKVELHTHAAGADGVMMMRKVEEGFAVPAGGEHLLQRGGDHVMLMGMTRKLEQGENFALTLTFEKAGDITIEVPVDLSR